MTARFTQHSRRYAALALGLAAITAHFATPAMSHAQSLPNPTAPITQPIPTRPALSANTTAPATPTTPASITEADRALRLMRHFPIDLTWGLQ